MLSYHTLNSLKYPTAATAPDRYRFDPEIERVSGQMYCNGQNKSAALEA
jgi:hypothetical protein